MHILVFTAVTYNNCRHYALHSPPEPSSLHNHTITYTLTHKRTFTITHTTHTLPTHTATHTYYY